MKDEIKEILDKLKDTNNYISHSMILLSSKETIAILDYIINLQESEAYYYGQYKDYKSRTEKANEFIKQSIKESQLIFGWNNIQRYHDNEMNELSNILNGKEI